MSAAYSEPNKKNGRNPALNRAGPRHVRRGRRTAAGAFTGGAGDRLRGRFGQELGVSGDPAPDSHGQLVLNHGTKVRAQGSTTREYGGPAGRTATPRSGSTPRESLRQPHAASRDTIDSRFRGTQTLVPHLRINR